MKPQGPRRRLDSWNASWIIATGSPVAQPVPYDATETAEAPIAAGREHSGRSDARRHGPLQRKRLRQFRFNELLKLPDNLLGVTGSQAIGAVGVPGFQSLHHFLMLLHDFDREAIFI